ncbi:hypothetical protein [Novipirellula rosea]|uniref:hypothetical protein n=1 Tax=Novipirellula rosea TaxID=1031540 RepID=UPI0031F01205
MSAKDNDWKFGFLVASIVGGVLIATGLLWYVIGEKPRQWYPGAENGFQQAAQFGDSYGYVNALLSSLALGGALAAIFLQTIELRWQRKELQESQVVWREQTRQAEMQARQQELQALVMADQVRAIDRQTRAVLLSTMYAYKKQMADAERSKQIDPKWIAERIDPVIHDLQTILMEVDSRGKNELEREIVGILRLCLSKINESQQDDYSGVGVMDLKKSVFSLRRYGLRGRESLVLSSIENVLETIESVHPPSKQIEPLKCLGWTINQLAESIVQSEGIELDDSSYIPEHLLGEYGSTQEQLEAE